MPVLESTDSQEQRIVPKSLVRHRPIEQNSPSKDAKAHTTTVPVAQRASRPSTQRTSSDASERKHTTTPGKIQPAPHAIRQTIPGKKPQQTKRSSGLQAHPLLFFGLGMIVMLLLWLLLSSALGWVTTTLDDLHYGRPRTYQTDAWVGHNEQTGHPSHFIVLNLHGQIEIIEIAGGDPAHTHIYTGPHLSGTNADLTPVTVRFVTPTGKKYPNMVVLFGNSQVLFLNNGSTFAPQ